MRRGRGGGVDRRELYEPLPTAGDVGAVRGGAAADGAGAVSAQGGRGGDHGVFSGPRPAAAQLGHRGVGGSGREEEWGMPMQRHYQLEVAMLVSMSMILPVYADVVSVSTYQRTK